MSRQASGLRAWIFQRVTAIAMLLYFPFLLLSLAFGPPANHAEWVAWLSQPLVGMGFLVERKRQEVTAASRNFLHQLGSW